MYIGRDFPSVEDGASRILGFDLAGTLANTEIITSIVTTTLALLDGLDPALDLDPNARFIGTTSWLGTNTTQGVSFADATNVLAGNVYKLTTAAATSRGQVIAPWARIVLQAGHGYPSVPTGGPPNTAQVTILPVSSPKFTLPSSGGYAGQDFPTINQGETRFFGFDLSPALSVTEEITSASFALTVEEGDDPIIAGNPAAYLSGSSVTMSGTIEQLIAWPVPLPVLTGSIYVLNVVALTNFNQAIEAWARITIGD